MPQVPSSYVYSWESYRVDKHTNKQTPLKTANIPRYATTLHKHVMATSYPSSFEPSPSCPQNFQHTDATVSAYTYQYNSIDSDTVGHSCCCWSTHYAITPAVRDCTLCTIMADDDDHVARQLAHQERSSSSSKRWFQSLISLCCCCCQRRLRRRIQRQTMSQHSDNDSSLPALVTTTLRLRKVPTFKLSLTLSDLNRFSKFLHSWKAYGIC